MKKIFSFLFSVTALFIAGAVSYDVLATSCQKGLEYAIGDIATEFNVDADLVARVAEQAADIWNQEIGSNVIVYNKDADFKVAFLFDERQEKTIERQSSETEIDSSRSDLNAVTAKLDALQSEYDDLQSSYQKNRTAYQSAQADYNKKVSNANNGSGSSDGLEAARKKLEAQFGRLEVERKKINSMAEELNKQSTLVNEQVASFNGLVNNFNNNFGSSGETFRQGVYNGKGIEIYQYENEKDLLGLLVHEFGHALGIDHVEDPMSVMYYLQHDTQDSRVTFTEADRSALVNACETAPFSIKRLGDFFKSINSADVIPVEN